MSLAAYSATVARVFDAVLDERQTRRALRAIANYAGVSGAAYFLVNKLSHRVSAIATWGGFTGSRADYLTHYSTIDPFRMIQEEAACGALARLSDRLPASALRRSEWYNDYVFAGGVCDVLGTKLHENASHMVMIGLHRAIGDTDPFPRDETALAMLIPPLRNAARLHLDLIGIGVRSAIARAKFNHLQTGVIFTDGSGRIVEANQAGEAILRDGTGLTMRSGQICARRSFETTKLAHLIANATASGSGDPSAGCMLIAREDGRAPYVVRVVPVSPRSAGYNLPVAMILVSAPNESLISERELADLYGLSPVESRLALALARGKRLTDLVGEFGVQVTTLRTQLSSVLKKCEVERQSDLVRLIASIPAVYPIPHATERYSTLDAPSDYKSGVWL
jgi:PAS domain-containing protein/DNA-binding CsgD family transcriptional regulator